MKNLIFATIVALSFVVSPASADHRRYGHGHDYRGDNSWVAPAIIGGAIIGGAIIADQCWVRRRVWTRDGWRWRRVRVC